MNKQENHQGKSFFLKGANGTGVLLFHGWTSPPDELLPLAKYLNSLGYTVSAPLLRGHGTRPEDLECVHWKDWLKDARRALQEFEKITPKIIVGGISMGGDIAMHLAEENSVAGVIVLGAAVKYKVHFLAGLALFFMGLTKKYRKKYYPPWVRKKIGNRKVYMYYPIESAKEVMRLAIATREILSRITKPILIMQSTTDHMVSRKSPQMIFDGVSAEIKEIYWVENAYHVFVEDEKVWKKIGEFILRAF
ncbi:MAG TPA: alpha/beta fold hydrolase [Candidatus Bathyarchaeia archaeon]|nr:alpha/beta fold hydrolase [Candidatus Bathyarchaeia archaeon]